MFYGFKSYNTCSDAVLQHWHSPTIVCHSFFVLSMIRFSKSAQKSAVQVSSCCCYYGNHTAGS